MNREQLAEKKQIIEDVKTRMDRGEPKQQILEELSQTYKDKVTIVKQLEHTPSKIMKHKYRTYNYGLAALLQVSLILDIVTLFRLDWGDRIIDICLSLNVALGTIFLFGVLLYRIDTYSWIATGAITTLVAIVSSLLYYHRDIDPLVMISLALIVISFVLGMFLGVKLCPQRIPKTIEVDIDGVEKINKTIYVFPD